MDKFLLAENPLRPDCSGMWIVHMLNPKAIIRCTEGHVKPTEEIYEHYQFTNIDGVPEEWTLSVYHFFTTDFISEPEDQAKPLLKKAWHWYKAYMKWEDKRIDHE